MVFYASADDEPESAIYFRLIYNKDFGQNDNLLFDFQVGYTRIPEIESSDGEEEDYSNLETQTVSSTHQFGKEWLFRGDRNYIEGVVVRHILDLIDVPCYGDLVWRLTHEIWKLKECDTISPLQNVEKIEIDIDF